MAIKEREKLRPQGPGFKKAVKFLVFQDLRAQLMRKNWAVLERHDPHLTGLRSLDPLVALCFRWFTVRDRMS